MNPLEACLSQLSDVNVYRAWFLHPWLSLGSTLTEEQGAFGSRHPLCRVSTHQGWWWQGVRELASVVPPSLTHSSCPWARKGHSWKVLIKGEWSPKNLGWQELEHLINIYLLSTNNTQRHFPVFQKLQFRLSLCSWEMLMLSHCSVGNRKNSSALCSRHMQMRVMAVPWETHFLCSPRDVNRAFT